MGRLHEYFPEDRPFLKGSTTMNSPYFDLAVMLARAQANQPVNNVIPMTPPKWYARAQIDSTIPIITLVKALATERLTCKSVNGVLRIQEAK